MRFSEALGDDSQILNQNDDLEAGDEIYVYGKAKIKRQLRPGIFDSITTNTQLTLGAILLTLQSNQFRWDPVYSELQVVSDTTYPQTTTDAYLIKDAAESIVSKLVGQNSAVKSDTSRPVKDVTQSSRGKHVGLWFRNKAIQHELWRGWWEPIRSYSWALVIPKWPG